MNDIIIFDVEVTDVGQFVGFKTKDTITHIDLFNTAELIEFITANQNKIFVGFNNFNYDNKVLQYCLTHFDLSTSDLLKLSDKIIKSSNERDEKGKKKNNNLYNLTYNSITINTKDVYMMLKNKMSLKLASFVHYGYLFNNSLLASTSDTLKQYNVEDLNMTYKLFEDKCLETHNLELYLANHLNIDSISNNLTISVFLNKRAGYNHNYNFKSCLDNLGFIDDDLKVLALKLLDKSPTVDLNGVKASDITAFTNDGIKMCLGGLHYPLDSDFVDKGVRCFDLAYNYDYASYYPNIYIHLLNFFDTNTKELLINILNDRLKAKQDNDSIKNNALKLFINSVYGQLAKINKSYMYSVALMGQVILIQLLRDNNITLDDVVEINTDGVLLKSQYSLDTLINKSGIELEESVLTHLYHKNSNTKAYTLDGQLVIKGKLLKNTDYTDKVCFFDLTPVLQNDARPIYNCFIVKHKVKGSFDDIKYYKFKDIEAIKNYKLKDNCTLFNKDELKTALEDNILEEIDTYNYEIITDIVKPLFDSYLKDIGDYDLLNEVNDFRLKHNDVNDIYQKYKDIFYMIPSNKKKYYAKIKGEIKHKGKEIHNKIIFSQKPDCKTLGVLCGTEYVAIDIDDANLVPEPILNLLDNTKAIKVITVDKNGNQVDNHKVKYIFKAPSSAVIYKKLDGLEYLTKMKKCNIFGLKEANKYYKVFDSDVIDVVPPEFIDKQAEPTHTNQNSSTVLDYSIDKLNELNSQCNIMSFSHDKNESKYIKLTSPCYNNHESGNNKSVMIILQDTYCTISCFASSCELNDNNSKEYKELRALIYKIFYNQNNDRGYSNDFIGLIDNPASNNSTFDYTNNDTNNNTPNLAVYDENKPLIIPTVHKLVKFDFNVFNDVIELDYIYKLDGHLLPRGVVGMVTSRGGLGKSQFMLNLMTQLVIGKRDMMLNNLDILDNLNIIYYSLEDSEPIVKTRLQTVAKAYDLDDNEKLLLTERLKFVFDLGNRRLSINQNQLRDEMIAKIKETKSQLIVIDTLARICDVDAEIDNIKATQFMQVLEYISKATNSTILLLHHTNKQSVSDNSVLANARGSSALVDSCRYVLTLKDFIPPMGGYKNMKQREALENTYKAENLANIIDVTTAKANHSKGLSLYLARTTNSKLKVLSNSEINGIIGKYERLLKNQDDDLDVTSPVHTDDNNSNNQQKKGKGDMI